MYNDVIDVLIINFEKRFLWKEKNIYTYISAFQRAEGCADRFERSENIGEDAELLVETFDQDRGFLQGKGES